jgi:hypothetical protein
MLPLDKLERKLSEISAVPPRITHALDRLRPESDGRDTLELPLGAHEADW